MGSFEPEEVEEVKEIEESKGRGSARLDILEKANSRRLL